MSTKIWFYFFEESICIVAHRCALYNITAENDQIQQRMVKMMVLLVRMEGLWISVLPALPSLEKLVKACFYKQLLLCIFLQIVEKYLMELLFARSAYIDVAAIYHRDIVFHKV